MNIENFTPGTNEHPVVVTRVADDQWQAVQDEQTVGSGDVCRRPDGRTFISIDAWHDTVFDRLALAMSADLPTPLYVVADETDLELTSRWRRAGFTDHRREWEYAVPTDPRVTGLGSVRPPADLTVVAAGGAEDGPLRALDRAIRDEVGAGVGWHTMPAEVIPLPPGVTVLDPSKYAVAVRSDRYVGMLRLATATRRPRIGLLAVRADQHRTGVGRALLAQVLGALHEAGTGVASAEVDESNTAAVALFEGVGAQRVNSNLELVRR